MEWCVLRCDEQPFSFTFRPLKIYHAESNHWLVCSGDACVNSGVVAIYTWNTKITLSIQKPYEDGLAKGLYNVGVWDGTVC